MRVAVTPPAARCYRVGVSDNVRVGRMWPDRSGRRPVGLPRRRADVECRRCRIPAPPVDVVSVPDAEHDDLAWALGHAVPDPAMPRDKTPASWRRNGLPKHRGSRINVSVRDSNAVAATGAGSVSAIARAVGAVTMGSYSPDGVTTTGADRDSSADDIAGT